MGIVRNDLEILRAGEGAFSITPSNAATIQKTRGIYVGASGDLDVTFADGSRVTLVDVAAGITHYWQIIQVWATGTTATGIIGII